MGRFATAGQLKFTRTLFAVPPTTKRRWHHLTERMNYEKRMRKDRMRMEISQTKKENEYYLERVSQVCSACVCSACVCVRACVCVCVANPAGCSLFIACRFDSRDSPPPMPPPLYRPK